MKNIFKFRLFRYKWFGMYLFPKQRHELGIGIDYTDGDYPLLFLNIIFICFDITFAPNSYFNPSEEERERIEKIMNLSEEEKEKLAMNNILESMTEDSMMKKMYEKVRL